MDSSVAPRIALVGAGWAGLTCALELALAGVPVTLFEASRIPGGRARRVAYTDGKRSDNGQHMLLGAYRETLRQIARVHPNERDVLHRIPLTLQLAQRYDAPIDIAVMHKPSPLLSTARMLFSATGLSFAEKRSFGRAMLGLMYGAEAEISEKISDKMPHIAPQVLARIIHPLCLAALNTPAPRASALVFQRVMRAAFRGPSTNSDFLIPRVDLTTLFPEKACAEIAAKGGDVRLGERVEGVSWNGRRFLVHARDYNASFDHVVIAVAPQHVSRVLRDAQPWHRVGAYLDDLTYEPISTIFDFEYEAPPLPPPLLLGVNDPLLQWVVHDALPKMRSVVISGADAHADLDQDAMLKAVAQRLDRPPERLRLVCEKRATYSCTPAQNARLQTLPTLNGPLWLAGDYRYPDFPATIEAAARSGKAVADAIISHIRPQ